MFINCNASYPSWNNVDLFPPKSCGQNGIV